MSKSYAGAVSNMQIHSKPSPPKSAQTSLR
jgi:hypothetical protein